MSGKRSSRRPGALWGLFGLVTVFAVSMDLVHVLAIKRGAPDISVRIGATLVSWGITIDGLSIPVSADEIDRHVALLSSPDGEQRVRGADWLASRGVRGAGPEIAAAMADEGTLRPCQLAHSLGRLGDDRWIGTLLDAANNPRNADLRACATTALGDIASPTSVDALIELCRTGSTRSGALYALGRIGDPSALGFLRSVAASPGDELERGIALRAIERIGLMERADPVPGLIARVRAYDRRERLEPWAVRKLAELHDARAIPALQYVLRNPQLTTGDRIVAAAGLLAHGEEGAAALQRVVESQPDGEIGRTAMAALRLVDAMEDGQALASR